jgi:hypothetical protein
LSPLWITAAIAILIGIISIIALVALGWRS